MLATTLSLVAVFLPVAFMGGIVGRFMNSLRHHHGVRDRGLAAGQLHADADAVLARWLKRPRRRRPRQPARARDAGVARAAAFYGRVERAYLRPARLVAWATAGWSWSPMHRWRSSRPVPLFVRGRTRTSCPTTTSRSSRSACARPKERACDDDADDRRLDRQPQIRELPGVRDDGGHDRRRPAADAEPGRRSTSQLQPIERAQARPVRSHGAGPRARSCRSTQRSTCASRSAPVRAFGGGVERRDPVLDRRPRPRPSSTEYSRQLMAKLQEDARRRRRRHQPDRRQAGAAACASTAPRRPTSACSVQRHRRARCNVLVGGQKVTTYYEKAASSTRSTCAPSDAVPQRRAQGIAQVDRAVGASCGTVPLRDVVDAHRRAPARR